MWLFRTCRAIILLNFLSKPAYQDAGLLKFLIYLITLCDSNLLATSLVCSNSLVAFDPGNFSTLHATNKTTLDQRLVRGNTEIFAQGVFTNMADDYLAVAFLPQTVPPSLERAAYLEFACIGTINIGSRLQTVVIAGKAAVFADGKGLDLGAVASWKDVDNNVVSQPVHLTFCLSASAPNTTYVKIKKLGPKGLNILSYTMHYVLKSNNALDELHTNVKTITGLTCSQ